MDRVHYNVDSIINNNMKTAVKNALENIDGVQMVNVDLGNQSVEVGYNKPADEIKVKRCIEKSGLTINCCNK